MQVGYVNRIPPSQKRIIMDEPINLQVADDWESSFPYMSNGIIWEYIGKVYISLPGSATWKSVATKTWADLATETWNTQRVSWRRIV